MNKRVLLLFLTGAVLGPLARTMRLDPCERSGHVATICSMSTEFVQASVTAVIAVLAGSVVIYLARRQLLTFRFAAGWCLLFLLTALSGVLIPAVNPVAEALGTTPGVLVSATAIAILVFICIQLSVSISGLQKQIQKLAEEIALHQARRDNHLFEDSK